MKQFNIACVIGTRPEALKMRPVITALRNNPLFSVKTILTGQHRELVQQVMEESNVLINSNFNVMQTNQNLNSLSANLLNHFENYLNQNTCDLMIAQGDTTTTLMAALSAFHKKIPFAHIEAGLRTHCIQNPFPEELNRRVTSLAASLHFCPTEHAANNLREEGIQQSVYVTGNTIIDTLYQYANKIPHSTHNKKILLVTCHRRENFGAPFATICEALRNIAERNPTIEMIFPVHPNPNIQSAAYHALSGIQNITLSDPLSYPELVRVLKHSYLVLTDSGGLQEEAPALKKPVLVLRNETERPEGVALGAARLVGCDAATITENVEELLSNPPVYEQMSNAGSPYGDGKASLRIAKIIERFLLK